MNNFIKIGNNEIGLGKEPFIIAEMSANHNQSLERAFAIIEAAAKAGADAVKIQTYTPDTLTLDCDNPLFRIGEGTQWQGRTLYDLYSEAYTPWEWQPKLKAIADDLGICLFSTPFDSTSVDFLEEMGVPAYKIASFELVDLPLIRQVAHTKKPVVMSTGMATLDEIDEAVQTFCDAGGSDLVLLKCTSAYPAKPEEMNLKTISDMAKRYSIPIGLSDHTLGTAVPVAAVSLGACIIEKHFTLSRADKGPDSAFSLEPDEFRIMVNAIREAQKALGEISYELTIQEQNSRVFRRSLFVVKEMKAGDRFTIENVKSIRPAYGLHTKFLERILGKIASRDIEIGSPLIWEMIV